MPSRRATGRWRPAVSCATFVATISRSSETEMTPSELRSVEAMRNPLMSAWVNTPFCSAADS